ncbi:MAG: PolC-type DNA polymerase III [Clostridiales bacterium]|nr:PolC-type DNA polymerase III [Clostridiales bacterium]
MKSILEAGINWSSIKEYPKDNYRYHVRRAVIERESKVLTMEVCLNFKIQNEDIERIRFILKKEFPDITNVFLNCTYIVELPDNAVVIRSIKQESQKNGKEFSLQEKRILGRKISQDPIPISEIREAREAVCIVGEVFRKDIRPISNNKQLISLLLTDNTDSTCVKLFLSNEKSEEIDSYINVGDLIKVQGVVEYDNYEMAHVIIGKNIEKEEKHKRKDNAPVKRVELHAHTKMSAMDGLNDIKDLLITVNDWGHKAVAITDHGVVQAFPEAYKLAKKLKLNTKLILGMEGYLFDDSGREHKSKINYKSGNTYHIILLVKNRKGLKNLYKLVSLSHIEYFYRRPRIPKSVLMAHREGLIIGSACESGEIFQAVLNGKPEKDIKKLVELYDYLEIQPLVNNRFLVEAGIVKDEEGLKDLNRKIVEIGEKYNKPVVATCDSHYLNEEDNLYRKILMAGQGYKDAEQSQGLYLRTTDEMLDEFSYLGEDVARKIIIDNPNKIADSIEEISPVPEGRFPPKIENADERLRSRCMETAMKIYGDPLPDIVKNRLEKELDSIINNGYAVMYVSSELLVQQSLKDGYLVGSRGSVGSSFAATMAGITEVNPLPPHYICENPDCKHSEFPTDTDCDCGVDLPDKNCPKCGQPYKKDGFNIPFEVFLGFEGDKEPDIDLNFAGEYQAIAHKYVEEIFGKENVFRAGTIGTVADRTAYGFVKKYFEEKQIDVNKWEIERLTQCCTGVRRTTGQHPGGIIIVPKGHEIYEFCPIQHPANDASTDIITTHFDYHSIDENLLKLDILGHDVPSMIRMLQDMTGVDPLTVPLKDERVNGIFNGIETLDIKIDNYRFTHGTFGVPEFGTRFVRQMLDDIKPTRFSDLIRISGFSHGTDVWINNAQEFIRNGTAAIKDAISTRDDIMNYLIAKGVPSRIAFRIMENVRKGKGVTDEESQIMLDNGVPEWYIESCRRIQYMFPKAHAVAYVMMSYRIAYYKVYYPLAFYATFFSMKIADFNEEVISKGINSIVKRMEEIEEKGKAATKKEEDELTVLEVAYEMYARGYEFLRTDLNKSDATKFKIVDGKILIPFLALNGIGENAAKNLAEEREKGPFLSVDDIRNRAKLNKTAIEALKNAGVLKGLPESNQITLFS